MRWRDRLGSLGWHLAGSLLAALLLVTPQITELEQRAGLYWLFQLRGAQPAPQSVVIVALDGEAAQRLGIPLTPSEWPRALHAHLIDALVQAEARVIVFDLMFGTASKQATDDAQLAAAIEHAGRVVLVAAMRAGPAGGRQNTQGMAATPALNRLVPPIPAFERAALGHAPFILPKQGRVDAYWTFAATAGGVSTLPVLAFQAFLRNSADPPPRATRLPEHSASVPDRPAAREGDGSLADAMTRQPARLAGVPEATQRSTDTAESTPRQGDAARELTDLYAGDDSRYLNFYGPPRTITTISYADALDGSHAALFAGKVVFVGFSGISVAEQDRVRDHYPTVFSRDDGTDLSGVEIAATACANLLEGRTVKPLPLAAQFGLTLVFGCALGALAGALSQRLAYPAVLVAGALYLAIATRVFAAHGLWLPLVVPLAIQVPLAALADTWRRYHEERRRVRAARDALAHFLPPEVVDPLIVRFGSVGSIRRPVVGVCLASDMEGYAGVAEALDPKSLAQSVNAYFSQLFEPVERHGGLVVDIVGDAMIAVWGAESDDPQIRRSACLAALGIVAATTDAARGSAGNTAYPTRIGLCAGKMLLVAVGASRHFEFRAVGDTINTAARLEGLSKQLGTRLLASAAVVAGLDEFLVRPVGDYLLVGKTEPVRVVELVGLRQEASSATTQLCSDFAQALRAYQDGAWPHAATLLADILARQPDDGPSHFLARLCQRHAHDPARYPWSPTIRMREK